MTHNLERPNVHVLLTVAATSGSTHIIGNAKSKIARGILKIPICTIG